MKLAVLPFANLTGDPEQEYLSDGVTQEMIAQLGRLHPQSLSVIARTSVMRYKKTDAPVDQVGNVEPFGRRTWRRHGRCGSGLRTIGGQLHHHARTSCGQPQGSS